MAREIKLRPNLFSSSFPVLLPDSKPSFYLFLISDFQDRASFCPPTDFLCLMVCASCYHLSLCGGCVLCIFLSLYVDGALFCAEGYTQVTGVMAMMTGRVLLVCALCVLWCGVCGGGCSETAPVLLGTGVTGNGNNPEGKNNTTDGVGGGGPTGQQAASQPAASLVPVPETKEESAPKTGARESGTAEEKIENKDTTGNRENEEGDRDTGEEDEAEEEVDDGKKEDGGEEKKKQEEKYDTSATKTKSAGGQEEPISPSRVEEVSNKTKPQSTQKTGNKHPAADGEGMQEENKRK
ncbi:mucin-associated surface protein (MASP) [Trypanosoma cruzi Dm28c]|uniref:Mucin-associated surface protein (MASP) n=1 Tax=Trypanosoma cruzi Dm28c TaxID=1416333 RepID=V5ALK6_TRYCR|nr:mucin-associated surface protein (MASP) [Trypanosoma cruzi Dm28c]